MIVWAVCSIPAEKDTGTSSGKDEVPGGKVEF